MLILFRGLPFENSKNIKTKTDNKSVIKKEIHNRFLSDSNDSLYFILKYLNLLNLFSKYFNFIQNKLLRFRYLTEISSNL